MRIYVGITDERWFLHLSAMRPPPDEVNFWRPGGTQHFRAIGRDEPFLFKLHAPKNFIVGGGFLARESILPIELAWEAFEEKNGVAEYLEFYRRIVGYRRNHVPGQQINIGCVILRDPFFFPRAEWIPAPAGFAPNIVQGKTYDDGEAEGAHLWSQVMERLPRIPAVHERVVETDEMYGAPRMTRHRLGQGTFRVAITDAYHRRCAVSGERALPALEAAHILPVSLGGVHRIDNGLLLRSDIHRLYDRGYVTVTPDHRFEVSGRLKTDWNNGEPYYPMNGRTIEPPKDEAEWPSREFLERHADEVFLR